MTTYCAFLRAINVGGTGKLKMSELSELCRDLGFKDVHTYIQSGNLVFNHSAPALSTQRALAEALKNKLGKDVGVLLRTASQLEEQLQNNPFPKAPPAQVIVMMYPAALRPAELKNVVSPAGEELKPRGKDLYIYYPNGQGRSKLKIPQAEVCTGRNLNTLTKVLALSQGISNATRSH